MITAKVTCFYSPSGPGIMNWIDPDTWGSYIGNGIDDGKWAHRFFTRTDVATSMPGALAAATLVYVGYNNSGDITGTAGIPTLQIDLVFNTVFQETDFDTLISVIEAAAANPIVEGTLDAFDSAGNMAFVKAYATQASDETP